MLCKIADLYVDIPEAGGMSPRCRDYLVNEDVAPHIIIKEENGNGFQRYYINSDFIVDIRRTDYNKRTKSSLMYLWVKNGFIKKALPNYLTVETYYTDKKGLCWERYNITHTKDHKINFDWLFEDTEENREKLLNACIDLYDNKQ